MGRVTSVRRAMCPVSSKVFLTALTLSTVVALPSTGFANPPDAPGAAAGQRSRIVSQVPISRAPLTPGQRSDPSTREAASSGYKLSSAELISVRVRGYSEFSGEYRINADRTISIPRIGRIVVGDLSPAELESHLGQSLGAALRQEVNVAVEVVRFRPFFMTGQVTHPGSVEWRPDLTLIQAISLSGGVARPAARSDLGTPEQRLLAEQAKVRHSFAVAQHARLSAEKARKESVETDQLLRGLIAKAAPESREALEAYLSRQNQLLEEQRAAHEIRITGLQRERDAALGELEAARAQSDEIKVQVELIEAHMEGLESLRSQQLLTNTRYLEARRSVAEIRVRYSESLTLVQRARSRYSSVEREIHVVQSERDAMLNGRIEELEREIAELELTLRDAGMIDRASAEAQPALIYHIARKNAAGVQTLIANLFTEVLPGDVIIVSRQLRPNDGPGGVVTAATGRGTLEETQRIMESSISPAAPSAAAELPPAYRLTPRTMPSTSPSAPRPSSYVNPTANSFRGR